MVNSINLRKHIQPLVLILIILLLSRVMFIYFMPATYSKDLYAWLDVINILKNGENPYYSGVLNWPPFWIQMLYIVGRIADYTAIPATTIIQSLLIAGECFVVLICYAVLLRIGKQKKIFTAIVASLALNPVCIFLSCQHGNFDVFVGMWILLFSYALLDFFESKSQVSWLVACFFLGMGIFTKTIPFVLAPLLMVGIQQQRKTTTLFGLVLMLAPVTIGMGVLYTLAPKAITDNVLSYRSMSGWYGISGILNLLGFSNMIDTFSSISPYLILGMMAFIALRLRKKDSLNPKELLLVLLTMLLFLPTFGPGYSPPYILWYLPLMTIYCVLAPPLTQKLMIAGFLCLILTYTIEYATFNSHGSFLKFFDHSGRMAALCEHWGRSKSQSLIRLPMFLFYFIFYISILRDKDNFITQRTTGLALRAEV